MSGEVRRFDALSPEQQDRFRADSAELIRLVVIGARVTNARPGAGRVSGVVVAIEGEQATVQGSHGEVAMELLTNLRRIG